MWWYLDVGASVDESPRRGDEAVERRGGSSVSLKRFAIREVCRCGINEVAGFQVIQHNAT